MSARWLHDLQERLAERRVDRLCPRLGHIPEDDASNAWRGVLRQIEQRAFRLPIGKLALASSRFRGPSCRPSTSGLPSFSSLHGMLYVYRRLGQADPQKRPRLIVV